MSRSTDDELTGLLHASLVGEVRGEAFFRALRDAAPEGPWRATLETLRELEERTAETLVHCLTRLGLPMPALDTVPHDGAVHAATVAAFTPIELADHLAARRPAFVATYRRIGELLPPDQRAVAEILVDHTRTTESMLSR